MPSVAAFAEPPLAVLFDRDDTLVVDVPYNDDPALVRPMPGAVGAVDRLRRAGLRLGIVSNQSGVARGLLTMADVAAVNGRHAGGYERRFSGDCEEGGGVAG